MAEFTNLLHEDNADNMGGIQTIGYFIKESDIETHPPLADDTGSLTGNFTLKANKVWKKIYSTMDKGKVESPSQGENDGQSFKHSATIFHPGTKAETNAFMRMINNSNMVFIFLTPEGERQVVGSRAFPAKCKPSHTSGEKTADLKGMTMTIESYGNSPAPLYTGTIVCADETIAAIS